MYLIQRVLFSHLDFFKHEASLVRFEMAPHNVDAQLVQQTFDAGHMSGAEQIRLFLDQTPTFLDTEKTSKVKVSYWSYRDTFEEINNCCIDCK